MATYMYPKNQPHPHAEKMAQYAEDAKEMDRPWERWEFVDGKHKNWLSCAHNPNWIKEYDYRRKPQTVKVCGELSKDELKELTLMVDMGHATNLERRIYFMIRKGCVCS